ALVYVQRAVNRYLEMEISPRLLWELKRNSLGLHLVPSSLHRAMWLQFAQAIGGNKSFRRCLECGKWFEVSPKTTRSDREYCSDQCRSKAYRDRKERA